MPQICCPICGSDQIELIPRPHLQSTPQSSYTSMPKPPMHSLMHYLVNYAAMGVTGARMLKGQKPVVLILGAVIGGAVGCAACLLNHLHDSSATYPKNTSLQVQNPLPQVEVEFHCLECDENFAFQNEVVIPSNLSTPTSLS